MGATMTEIKIDYLITASIFSALGGLCLFKQCLTSTPLPDEIMLFVGTVLSVFLSCKATEQSGIFGDAP